MWTSIRTGRRSSKYIVLWPIRTGRCRRSTSYNYYGCVASRGKGYIVGRLSSVVNLHQSFLDFFRVPKVQAGPYNLVLDCPSRSRGPILLRYVAKRCRIGVAVWHVAGSVKASGWRPKQELFVMCSWAEDQHDRSVPPRRRKGGL
jgi:hypothetical protein